MKVGWTPAQLEAFDEAHDALFDAWIDAQLVAGVVVLVRDVITPVAAYADLEALLQLPPSPN